jgi:hypothetical protein
LLGSGLGGGTKKIKDIFFVPCPDGDFDRLDGQDVIEELDLRLIIGISLNDREKMNFISGLAALKPAGRLRRHGSGKDSKNAKCETQNCNDNFYTFNRIIFK